MHPIIDAAGGAIKFQKNWRQSKGMKATDRNACKENALRPVPKL
ncbi:hypothetical protein BH09PLA1_BH09PLA1_07570 [soil metagenome]